MVGCNGGRSSGRRGVSLIECCVAVAGSAALVAALAGASVRMSSDAMSAQDRANLQNIGQASAAWSADHQGWIVGSPGTSGRDLLNDADALNGLALDLPHDATQPFDWAGPLAWNYLAPGLEKPARRDERFVRQFGVDANNPMQPAADALAVFHDPAQGVASVPFDGSALRPTGIDGTFFQPQLALSYVAAREFLWWSAPTPGSQVRPTWAGDDYWGSQQLGTVVPTTTVDTSMRLPRADAFGAFPPYRPRLERIGDPASKIFLANGTRFQRPELSSVDHDATAKGGFGGAFADAGAWGYSITRAYMEGTDASGRDMVETSFRRVDGEGKPAGHVLFFDGGVRLMSIGEARRPEWWTPRGARVLIFALDPAIQAEYQQLTDPGTNYVRIWN